MTSTLATDPTCAALLRAVLANPADDAPRLILADRLDEIGQGERASFIRVQCELARLKCFRVPAFHGPASWHHECRLRHGDEFSCHALRRRERELWPLVIDSIQFSGFRYLEGVAAIDPFGIVRRGFIASASARLATLFGGPCERCEGRGSFIDTLDLRPGSSGREDCLTCHGSGRTPGIAAELWAREPVTDVRITDREPFRSFNRQVEEWYWIVEPATYVTESVQGFDQRRSTLPVELFDAGLSLTRFPSRDLALAALSTAAVRLGRKRAGLSPAASTGYPNSAKGGDV